MIKVSWINFYTIPTSDVADNKKLDANIVG